jgi:hypothetical protein
MRRFVPFVLIGLSAASPLAASPGATGGESTARAEVAALPEPTTSAALAEEAPAAAELRLDAVRVEQKQMADEADAAQWPRRGSFWWLVGVIVVAGVILAVLL